MRAPRTFAVDECRCAVTTALPHGLLGPTTARAWPACVRACVRACVCACVRACVACCSTHGVRACASQRRRCVIRCMLHVICILAWPCRALPCRMVIARRPIGPARTRWPRRPAIRSRRCSTSRSRTVYAKQSAAALHETNKQTHQALRCCLASPRLAARPTGGRRAGHTVRRSLFPIGKLPAYLLLVASRAF